MIKGKVNQLKRKYETSCPFEIADSLGVAVFARPLGSILGFYTQQFRMKSIHINEQASEKEKLFICAHELGHSVLHTDASTPFLRRHTLFSTDRIEKEANLFAVNLLAERLEAENTTISEALHEYNIPEDLIKEYIL